MSTKTSTILLGTFIILLALLLLTARTASAAPLEGFPVTVTQPDGTTLQLYVTGDEYYNWLHDANGYTVMQDPVTGYYVYANLARGGLVPTQFVVGTVDPASVGLRPYLNISPEQRAEIRQSARSQGRETGREIQKAPLTGTINNLVIFIRFSGEAEFTDATSGYTAMLNDATAGANSLRNYYREVSYNALTINSTLLPTPGATVVSYQDTHPRSYFQPFNAATNTNGYQNESQSTSREHTLLRDAITHVNNLGQFPLAASIDADSDGTVDSLTFIVSGAPDGWTDLLWPHQWNLYTYAVTIRGKAVDEYSFQLNSMLGTGVLAHEMFHVLGAPDLYHYTDNGIQPVGGWDVMEYDADPPQHMGCFMKYRYGGWIGSIPEITTAGTYTLNPLTSSTNNCKKIASPYSATEYFVVEYRNATTSTFESSLPGSGLLVYRINAAQDGEGNAYGPPDEVYLYRPGGTLYTDGNVNTAHFSSSVGRTAINDTTNPSSFLSTGGLGGLNLCNIGAAGATISFDICDQDIFSISGNAGVGGATLSYTGGGSVTADPSGNYSIPVESGWSGTVTPSKTGYTFDPSSRTYPAVTANQTGQNYTASGPVNLLQDPSFEASIGSSLYWAQSSTNFGTPVCTPATCGESGAQTGSAWAWFGGAGSGDISPEIGSLSQNVTIPSGSATLQFYLWIRSAEAGSDAADAFTASIDGEPVFSADATQTALYPDYTLVSVDVGEYADGAQHTVTFSVVTTVQIVSFWLDDAALLSVAGGPSYTISGNAGVAGTRLTYPGGSATANSTGSYSFTVPDGWSGTVTPSKAGYTFTPSSIPYTNVTADYTAQDYSALAVGNLVEDPGFELYLPNPYWQETSTYSAELLCIPADCGGDGAHTGTAWAWLGGISDEVSVLSQMIPIPGGAATLEFYLWIYDAPAGSGADDVFTAKIDGTTVFSTNATQAGSYSDYTLVSVDISAFADGAPHTLALSSTTPGQPVSFFLDDISIEAPITISGNAGVGGATLSYPGGSVTADPSGNYSIPVESGWSGTVTPSRTGYAFDPPSTPYSNVTTNLTGEDYTATPLLGSVVRVEPAGAASAGCGTNWDDPCDLKYALANTLSGSELWVAAGTYRPAGLSGDRTLTFQLRSGIALYGGFAGTETARSERNWVTHVTTLSGDLNSNDGSDFLNTGENSYHVVTASGTDNTAVLDGFTIKGGFADGSNPHFLGGGIYNAGGSPALTNVNFIANWSLSKGGAIYNTGSPLLTNVGFDGNKTVTDGGAIYNTGNPALTNVTFNNSSAWNGGALHNYGGSPVLTNVVFNNNNVGTSGYGGGMYTDGGSPVLTDVSFTGNFAGSGGGLFVQGGSPTLTDIDFSGNNALNGAGMHNSGLSTISNATFRSNTAGQNGGGLFNNTYSTLTNVTFFDNETTAFNGAGGGMSSSGNPILTNVTFTGNSSNTGGGLLSSGNTILRNVILWGNTATTGAQMQRDTGTPNISNSVLQGGCPAGATCTNITTTNPLLGTLGAYGGDVQTIPLLPGSSAIAASGSSCPAADPRGVTRGSTCDAGAFESQGFSLTLTGGDGQTADIETAFTDPLALTVAANSAGEPVDGGVVTFSGPSSGASTNPPTSIATISGGAASLSVTANNTSGSYIVTASAAGASNSLTFDLTNYAPDLTPPVVTIAGLSPNPTNAGATLTWHANENGDYSVRVDGTDCSSGNVVASGTYSTSPASVNITLDAGDLAEGPNNLRVCVTDIAVNTGSAADSIDKDTSIPGVTIDGLSPNPTNAGATLTWHADENGSYSVRVGGASCASGTQVASGNYTASASIDTTIPSGNLNNGANTLRVCVTDAASNTGSDLDTVFKDAIAPVVTIDSLSPNPTSAGASLSWHADDNGPYSVRVGGTSCSSGSVIDSGTYSTSPASMNFTIDAGDLIEGPNTLRVCVTDAVFNTGSTSGSLIHDTTAPDTAITSHPVNPTSSPVASFGFSGTDTLTPPLSLTFECQLDGGGFSACTSPKEYSGLAETSHTFEVRATDLAGNLDTSPASYTWTIDAYPRVVSITRDSGSPTSAASVDFIVTFSEPVTGVNIGDFALAVANLTGASITAVNGSDETYTVTVKTGWVGSVNGQVGLNVVDNDSILDAVNLPLGGSGANNGNFTGESYIIAAHVTSPVLLSPTRNQLTNDPTPEFTWSPVADADHYEIMFAANSGFSQNVLSYSPVGTPYTSAPLGEGRYYWRVRAYNAANVAGPWSLPRYFTIDTTVPAIPAVSFPANGTSVRGTPTFRWNIVRGAVLYEFEIDDDPGFGSPFYSIYQRFTYRRVPGGARGTFYWHVRSQDAAGNWSAWSPTSTITILPSR